MDRQRLGINAVQVVLGRFLPQALGHTLQQPMAAVRRTDDGLAAFGHLHSRFPLERNVADDFALAVPRHGRNEFSGLDLVPVTAGREHLGVDVVAAVHFGKQRAIARRIALLRQIDDVIMRRRRRRNRGRRHRFFAVGSSRKLGGRAQAAMDADLPAVDAVFMA